MNKQKTGHVTNSAGNELATNRYDSFGKLVAQTGSLPFASTYTYTGREWDAEAGLYYYRARYYDPAVGRFISEDPIGFAGCLNFYAYVENNPVNFIDPSGQLAFFYHGWITYSEARNSGYGVLSSLNIAANVMAVDSNFFNPGTQGTNWEATRQHAMAGEGEIAHSIYQTPQQAMAATNAYIQENFNSGNYAAAIHAAQDLVTPAHAGQEWRSFGLNWETVRHIWGDIFPSKGTLSQARQNTRDCLR